MPDEFIFKNISSKIVVIKNNSSKYKDCRANFMKNNIKYNLYHVIGSININELEILRGYIYIDINKFRQNLYLKMISTIQNFFDDNIAKSYHNNSKPVISYNL